MQVTLSDGECVVLRPLREGDAPALLAFYLGLSEQSDWFYAPFPAEEYTLAKMEALVQGEQAGRACNFVVENESGEIAAHGFLWQLDQETPLLGIGITDRYQNRRLGHALMGHLIAHARDVLRRPGLRLDLNADNPRAFHLYCKMGFVETGRKIVNRGRMGRFGHGRQLAMIDMALQLAPR
jgi:ribosomal protein S18 acetylase RimI-like enzyme